MEETTKYGFYSASQAALVGICVYATQDGGTVDISDVGPKELVESQNKWPDLVCLGVVTRFVGRKSWGAMGNLNSIREI